MADPDEEPVEQSPATWENVVVGKVKEFFGRLTRNAKLEEEGEEQAEAAHEVHEEYREERDEERQEDREERDR